MWAAGTLTASELRASFQWIKHCWCQKNRSPHGLDWSLPLSTFPLFFSSRSSRWPQPCVCSACVAGADWPIWKRTDNAHTGRAFPRCACVSEWSDRTGTGNASDTAGRCRAWPRYGFENVCTGRSELWNGPHTVRRQRVFRLCALERGAQSSGCLWRRGGKTGRWTFYCRQLVCSAGGDTATAPPWNLCHSLDTQTGADPIRNWRHCCRLQCGCHGRRLGCPVHRWPCTFSCASTKRWGRGRSCRTRRRETAWPRRDCGDDRPARWTSWTSWSTGSRRRAWRPGAWPAGGAAAPGPPWRTFHTRGTGAAAPRSASAGGRPATCACRRPRHSAGIGGLSRRGAARACAPCTWCCERTWSCTRGTGTACGSASAGSSLPSPSRAGRTRCTGSGRAARERPREPSADSVCGKRPCKPGTGSVHWRRCSRCRPSAAEWWSAPSAGETPRTVGRCRTCRNAHSGEVWHLGVAFAREFWIWRRSWRWPNRPSTQTGCAGRACGSAVVRSRRRTGHTVGTGRDRCLCGSWQCAAWGCSGAWSWLHTTGTETFSPSLGQVCVCCWCVGVGHWLDPTFACLYCCYSFVHSCQCCVQGLCETQEGGLRETQGGGLRQTQGCGLRQTQRGDLRQTQGCGLHQTQGGGLRQTQRGGLRQTQGCGLHQTQGGDLCETQWCCLRETQRGGLPDQLTEAWQSGRRGRPLMLARYFWPEEKHQKAMSRLVCGINTWGRKSCWSSTN